MAFLLARRLAELTDSFDIGNVNDISREGTDQPSPAVNSVTIYNTDPVNADIIDARLGPQDSPIESESSDKQCSSLLRLPPKLGKHRNLTDDSNQTISLSSHLFNTKFDYCQKVLSDWITTRPPRHKIHALEYPEVYEASRRELCSQINHIQLFEIKVLISRSEEHVPTSSDLEESENGVTRRISCLCDIETKELGRIVQSAFHADNITTQTNDSFGFILRKMRMLIRLNQWLPINTLYEKLTIFYKSQLVISILVMVESIEKQLRRDISALRSGILLDKEVDNSVDKMGVGSSVTKSRGLDRGESSRVSPIPIDNLCYMWITLEQFVFSSNLGPFESKCILSEEGVSSKSSAIIFTSRHRDGTRSSDVFQFSMLSSIFLEEHVKRFKYHFQRESSPLNRVDRPEWIQDWGHRTLFSLINSMTSHGIHFQLTTLIAVSFSAMIGRHFLSTKWPLVIGRRSLGSRHINVYFDLLSSTGESFETDKHEGLLLLIRLYYLHLGICKIENPKESKLDPFGSSPWKPDTEYQLDGDDVQSKGNISIVSSVKKGLLDSIRTFNSEGSTCLIDEICICDLDVAKRIFYPSIKADTRSSVTNSFCHGSWDYILLMESDSTIKISEIALSFKAWIEEAVSKRYIWLRLTERDLNIFSGLLGSSDSHFHVSNPRLLDSLIATIKGNYYHEDDIMRLVSSKNEEGHNVVFNEINKISDRVVRTVINSMFLEFMECFKSKWNSLDDPTTGEGELLVQSIDYTLKWFDEFTLVAYPWVHSGTSSARNILRETRNKMKYLLRKG